MQAISSSLEKVSEWSPTLVGEGEGVRVGSQGEPLMQEQIDYERKADEAFTHPVPAYQVLSEQDNVAAERILYLVHTTASMQRAKDAITAMPPTTGDDFDYLTVDSEDIFGDEDDDVGDFIHIGGEAGPSSRGKDSIIPVSQRESTSEGEKVLNIQVSKVIIPATAFTKPPSFDSIDLIKIVAAKLESNDKLKKLDVTSVELELNKNGRNLMKTSRRSLVQLVSNTSQRETIQRNKKNPLDLMYETPKPDKKKLLGSSITFFKDPRDSVLKKRIAKRKLDFNEDKEEYMPTQSTTTSQLAIPILEEAEFKVDPNITFHDEPVIPNDKPIDWDSLPLPDLNIPIYAKPKKIKKRAVMMVKPVKLQSKLVAKPKPIVNKPDQLFICDIKEFSDINLYIEEIDEVRAIDAYRNLPERLVFRVHLRPYWIMEFKDKKCIRRFFILEYQLKISSNENLMEMQKKLDQAIGDELEFHKQLLYQIE
ncbi:hypothetical protein AgCh_005398 [Apium graveolens]